MSIRPLERFAALEASRQEVTFASVQPPETILDLTPAEATAKVTAWVETQGIPRYRAAQILRRLWVAPIGAWSEALELPTTLRTRLDEEMPLPRLRAEVVQESADGTRKFLWELGDGERVESVLIPSGARRTLCVSSQAGCALGCVFCATGQMGFGRNLAGWEIAGQLREIVLTNPADKPTNVVFMGMGEPLLNWPAVDRALTIFNDPTGFGIGARHITVSTVGIVPGMQALARRPEQFRLAISLHSPHAAQRQGLMPIEKKYPLSEVIEAARTFQRRITFEYVLIADRNDRESDAVALAALARRLGAHVNLLPLHPGGAPGLAPTSPAKIAAFRDALQVRGIEAVVRRSRGLDIDAACGQLRVAVERRRRAPAR
ncbi:MAG: 23S rRNA (adenine(2503)-C(2))-methyltransferase RlmN [Gemmatimonadales bacterium]